MSLQKIKDTYLATDVLTPEEIVSFASRENEGQGLIDLVQAIFSSRTEYLQGPNQDRILEILFSAEELSNKMNSPLTPKTRNALRQLLDKIFPSSDTEEEKKPEREQKRARPDTPQPEQKETKEEKPKIAPESTAKKEESPKEVKAPTSTQSAGGPAGAPSSGRISPGLANGGNWCYANSVIKLLLSSPLVCQALQHQNSPIAEQLKKIKEECDKPDAPPFLPVDKPPLSLFFQEAQKLFPALSTHAAQDSEELLRVLLQAINYPELRIKYRQTMHPPKGSTFQIDDIQTHTVLPFHVTDLPKTPSPGDTLDHLVHSAHSVTILQEQECPTETQTILASPPPDVLFTHVIRYVTIPKPNGKDVDVQRSARPIMVPNELEIPQEGVSTSARYLLRSFAAHSGGHYTAYERRDNGTWFVHDDKTVRPVEEAKVVQSIQMNGVLFCYEKR